MLAAILSSGRLEKMRFDGFGKPDFISGHIGTFHVQINPETFVRNYAIEYASAETPGNQGAEMRYNHSVPQTLDVEFILDATGVLPENGIPQSSPIGNAGMAMDLREKINALKSTVYNFIGDTHEPPYVMVTWAKEAFKCRVTAINITYKLFRPDGTPLRAQVKCSFKEYVPAPENANVAEAASPDLTHVRTVKEGDSLPLMCFRIYEDESLYLEVARVNKLRQFRKLKTGQQLFFPPLDKQNK